MARGDVPTPETLLGLPELPDDVFLLGDEDHYGTVRWYQDLFGSTASPMANAGDETLLAFVDAASAMDALDSVGDSFHGFELIPTSFEGAREIAKREDLEGVAIVRSPSDVHLHYVR